ncbi:MAG: methionyl-tRNA formyltransferase [Micrococcales bacterium]|nr:methionyl-tRNA formyltransferase [Micrococcales bacterium]
MKILFAGTPEIAVTVLGGLVNSGHEVVSVLTRNDAPVGRKRIVTPSPVATYAAAKNIPTIKANRIDLKTLPELTGSGADLGVVVAYGSILNKQALDSLPEGWYNLHFSLLPKYRGAAPVQRAILNGETETGVTLFRLDEGMDTGPILGQVPTTIAPDETSGELLQRLAHLGVTLLNEQLPRIYASNQVLSPQPPEGTSAPKLHRDEARIDFSNDAGLICNLIRAANPEPGAWSTYDGLTSKILSARIVPDQRHVEIGTVLNLDGKPVVVCDGGSLIEIATIQPSGKSVMTGEAWLRGIREFGKFS